MAPCPNFIFILGASYMSRLPPRAVKSTRNTDAKGHVCYRTTDVATATCHPSLSYSVTASGGMTVVHNDSHACDHNQARDLSHSHRQLHR